MQPLKSHFFIFMPKKQEVICGVYAIVNKINNKFYIGSSGHILRRFKQHKVDLKNKVNHSFYLQRAVDKYGIENFEFKIIELVHNINELKIREQYWLDFYKPYLREYGYNANPKSDDWTGAKHRPETIEKIRAIKLNMSDETKNKISVSCMGRVSSFKGKKHTEETKKLFSKLKLGIKHSKEQCLLRSIQQKGKKRGLSNGNGKYSDELLSEAISYSFLGFTSKEVSCFFGINYYYYNTILHGSSGRKYVYNEFIKPRLENGEVLTVH